MESKPYSLKYTPLAYGDLDEIWTYISEVLSTPQAAADLMDEMERSIEQLRTFPYIGSEVDDPYLASKGYRKLVVKNYLVFHLVSKAQRMVTIMRVVYGAREYRSIL